MGNFDETELAEGDENEEESYSGVELEELEGHGNGLLSTSKSGTPKSKQKIHKQSMTQFQKEILSTLTTPEDNIESDLDKAFLFSLLPDHKRLTYVG